MKSRPRISLLTALLLMTIAGMAILIVQLWREVGTLRADVRRLRDDVGELFIEDDTKIYAIQVRTADDFTWKWRVWVPERMHVGVNCRFGQVPKTGLPRAQGGVSFGPGEHWVELKARRNRSGKDWVANLSSSGGGGVETSIGSDDHWFDWKSTASTGDGVGTGTVMMDDDQSVFLLSRKRVAPVNSSAEVEKINKPTAGFIIWLERHYNAGSDAWAGSQPPQPTTDE